MMAEPAPAVGGWVWRENLQPLLEMASYLVAYRLDPMDLEAVSAGLDGSDADGDVWFEYPLGDVTLVLAVQRDGDEVLVKASGAQDGRFADRFALLLTVFASYRLHR
jgi:hypothetical protein